MLKPVHWVNPSRLSSSFSRALSRIRQPTSCHQPPRFSVLIIDRHQPETPCWEATYRIESINRVPLRHRRDNARRRTHWFAEDHLLRELNCIGPNWRPVSVELIFPTTLPWNWELEWWHLGRYRRTVRENFDTGTRAPFWPVIPSV